MTAATAPDHPSQDNASGHSGWGAALAALAGWYDFLIFPIVALAHFGPLFFPQASASQALASLVGLWLLAYVMRPLGALIFGYWGDRGRRTHALAAAVALSALGAGAIGALPTTAGWAVPVLVLCRALTGLGLGGAWSGGMVLAAEQAVPGRPSLAAIAQLGLPLAMLGTIGAVALFILLPTTSTETWPWRVPFLGALIFLPVAFYIAFVVPDRAPAERPASCAHTDTPVHRFGIALFWGVASALLASALTFFHGLFAVHYAGPEWDVPGLLYLAGVVLSAVGGLVGLGIGARLLHDMPAWGVVTLGALAASGAFVGVLVLLALVSVNWAFLLVPACIGALGIAYAGLPTLLADAFDAPRRYTGVALVSSLSGLFGALLPLEINHLAGPHATYALAWLILVTLAVSGLSALGALALNMARPDRDGPVDSQRKSRERVCN
ncbi:MFS transporter [Salinisphaera sp. Q1T1-3]|uniref:MFS transporter n=1 Tax=Salinisphaera sp. Q1T1-3 TaxID=2321229 RepID=UPI000E70FE8A|nr:MFS transporter [Salinisphaera sp. Q1T1-3]RJS95074.1 MFS transporter [Salinisphaera sp. Q1T1-3]